MGTHCYIGIEKDKHVEYIYIHFDGFFENVVPILSQYKNRSDVEKLIKCGSNSLYELSYLLSLSDEDIAKIVSEKDFSDRSHITSTIYSLVELSRRPFVPYIYVFTRDNEWLCTYTLGYFNMNELKYFKPLEN